MSAVFSLAYLALLIAGVAGWVMNIVAIVHTVNQPITGLLIARLVGVPAAPLGAILGWL